MEEIFIKKPNVEDTKGFEEFPTVLVTGFGPFGEHFENASWLTVKELLNFNRTNYVLVATQIPVEYEVVTKLVPELWKKYNPTLVVHCGVSDMASCPTLEKVAYNDQYIRCDVKGQLPSLNVCCEKGSKKLCTAIDIEKVLHDVKESGVCAKAVESDNAGRYLCEYIYYTSLNINRNTIFVHVPPANKIYSPKEMAQTLDIVINSMLQQIVI